MRKINLKWALKPHLWISTSIIGVSVHQLSMLPENTRSELLSANSFMIPSLIALGALLGTSLTKYNNLVITEALPGNHSFTERPLERSQLSSVIQHYQLLVEREIWMHENIKGWISYELHEDISQILVAARNHLHSSQPPHLIPSTQIEQARNILEEAIHKIRKLYEKLEVPPLQILGLIPCIQQKIEEENKTGVTNIIFRNSKTLIEEIEEPTKLMIYRIIVEKLNNISKHSKAKNAWILLEQVAQKIIIKIEDNGIGFYNSERQWRNGFNVIKTMITAMGGSFEIKSAPGRGCKFLAQIPAKRAAFTTIGASDLNHSFSAGNHSQWG